LSADVYAKYHHRTRQDVVEHALLKQRRGRNDSDVLVCSLAQQRNHIARNGGRVDVLMETLLAFVAVWFERRAPLVNEDERRQAAAQSTHHLVVPFCVRGGNWFERGHARSRSVSGSIHLSGLAVDNLKRTTAM